MKIKFIKTELEAKKEEYISFMSQYKNSILRTTKSQALSHFPKFILECGHPPHPQGLCYVCGGYKKILYLVEENAHEFIYTDEYEIISDGGRYWHLQIILPDEGYEYLTSNGDYQVVDDLLIIENHGYVRFERIESVSEDDYTPHGTWKITKRHKMIVYRKKASPEPKYKIFSHCDGSYAGITYLILHNNEIVKEKWYRYRFLHPAFIKYIYKQMGEFFLIGKYADGKNIYISTKRMEKIGRDFKDKFLLARVREKAYSVLSALDITEAEQV